MKSTYRTLMSLGFAALAPLALAQEPAAAPAAPAPEAAPALSPEEVKEVVSYYLGYRFGMQLDSVGMTMADLDDAAFRKALEDSFKGNPDPAMDTKIGPAMQAFEAILMQRAADKAAANSAAGKKFLEENAKKEGVVTTPSGLQYKVIRESRGMRYDEKTHGAAAECSVIYEGRLIDGTVFDSSEEPISMPLNGVIPGFTEALKLMPVGSTYEVYIPSELAYGAQGGGAIAPNSTLIFKITLMDITPGQPQAPAGSIQLTPELLQQLQQQDMQPAAN